MKAPLGISKAGLGLAIILLSLIGVRQSAAGPNLGGTLIVHANPSIVYTTDVSNYCGQSGLGNCADGTFRHDGADPVVFFIMAAFPASSSPRLSGVVFGIDYDATHVTLLASGLCGDFQLPTNGWPGPGEGNAITWNTAQTGHLVDIYWFAAYNYLSPSPAMFSITDHPVRGGGCCFADDAVPANLDPILAYGALGFDQPGVPACPDGGATGACCFGDCSCEILSEIECAVQGGDFHGTGVSCDPNPCCPPALGACCLGCECVVLTAADCAAQGGEYQGDNVACGNVSCGDGPAACCLDGNCFLITSCQCDNIGGQFFGDITTCDPDPCQPTPTKRESWGAVKTRYR